MIDSKMGYIFSKYEILYIAKMMGAVFITGIGFNSENDTEKIAKKACKSLIEKIMYFAVRKEN